MRENVLYADNKDADQTVHLHSLISIFVVRILATICIKTPLSTGKVLIF